MEPGKTVAAVDIGTNSVKLVIGRAGGGEVTALEDRTAITRLGKNVDASGRLDPAAVARTLEALVGFGLRAREWGAGRIAAVGTSALRDAANGAEFVERAGEALGGTVEVISGEREAELTFLSAIKDPLIRRRMAEAGATTLVTSDSGGGSTEFVEGEGEQVRYRQSLQLGAVRLTERVGFSDPPTGEELARAAALADEMLTALPRPQQQAFLVASGGTAANLAAMEQAAREPEREISPDLLHGIELTRGQIAARVEFLSAVGLEERRRTPGLEPDRADVIIAGAIIQLRTLERLDLPRLAVSARGLRYGLLYTLLSL